MRWIDRLLRRRPKPAPTAPETETPEKTPGQQEAESALARSERDHQRIRAIWPAVTHSATDLRRARERNHFAEMFRNALEGRTN